MDKYKVRESILTVYIFSTCSVLNENRSEDRVGFILNSANDTLGERKVLSKHSKK